MQQDYEENQENIGLKYSSSMYDRIKSWILNGNEVADPEIYDGNLVNSKVKYKRKHDNCSRILMKYRFFLLFFIHGWMRVVNFV